MKLFINFVIFQICWIVCILGGANGMPLLGVGFVAAAVAYHLLRAEDARAEGTLILP